MKQVLSICWLIVALGCFGFCFTSNGIADEPKKNLVDFEPSDIHSVLIVPEVSGIDLSVEKSKAVRIGTAQELVQIVRLNRRVTRVVPFGKF